MPARSVETLLRGVLDYAGMFPPASLSSGEAAAAYARYRAGADAWMVGTFVISAERLGELDPAVGPISLVINAQSAGDVERVLKAAGRMTIAAIEFRSVVPDQIRVLAAAVPDAVEPFFEVPADGDLDRRLDAVAASGAFAKIRTGGVTPDAFPAPGAVYRFLRGCADRRVAAKATAGLHHAVTGRYPLTYEPNSATALMYGFLNMGISAALVYTGVAEADVVHALGESSSDEFRFDDTGITWRGHRISTGDLAATRQGLFRSFGTCSLQEPIADVRSAFAPPALRRARLAE